MRDIYGENTIELSNIPLGVTPETLQERFRRFFSKFGHIEHCRVIPHSHDPYQCGGKGYITFRSKRAVWEAVHAPLKLPISYHDKIIHMKCLDNDKLSDPIWIKKQKHFNSQLLEVVEQLHDRLLNVEGAVPLEGIACELFLTEKDRKGRVRMADEAVGFEKAKDGSGTGWRMRR